MSFYFDPLCRISLQLSEADAKGSQAERITATSIPPHSGRNDIGGRVSEVANAEVEG